MLAHALALCDQVVWPSVTVLWIVTATPVIIGLLTGRIFVPGQSFFSLKTLAWKVPRNCEDSSLDCSHHLLFCAFSLV